MSKFEELCIKFEAICAKNGWEGRIVRVRGVYHDYSVFRIIDEDTERSTGVYNHIDDRYIPGCIDIANARIAAKVLRHFAEGTGYGENTN